MRNLHFAPVLLIVAAVPLLAQANDPPARVARINYLSGSVSFRPGSVEEWTAATLNYPLTTGDYLWADNDGRAEIHVGSAAIRMNSRTALSVLNLDDRTLQLSLTDGSIHIRLRDLADDEAVEIDTPNVAITLLRAGEYRIDADGDSSTAAVTVRSGNANVTGGGVAFAVRPRQTGKAIGMDNVSQDIGPSLPQSEFDYWCEARDRSEDEATASAQYVPRDMVGYEDLDRNGSWSDSPDYGAVWQPRTVPVDWAPYRYGHWVWIDPWGWTWIDDAPWGFAPFHYGRWVVYRGSWVWVPGHYGGGVRPVYAPALVVFVGTPGFHGAAWFPLGPREVYRPVYRTSDYYLRRVNTGHVTNVTNINVTNVYINQRSRGAITAVNHDVFVGRRPVGRELARIDEGRATVIGSAPPVPPDRVSLGGGARVSAAPPARVVERQVTVRRTPAASPVNFEARRAAMEANQGRPLDASEAERYRGGAARTPRVRVAAPPSAPAAPSQPNVQPAPVPERPVVVPRDERGPMRRPTMPAEVRTPEPRQQPAAAPAPAPPPTPIQREMRRPPQPEQPRVEAPRPTPVERPRTDRPERSEPRVERPPAEHRQEAKQERSEEKRVPQRGPKKEQKQDK